MPPKSENTIDDQAVFLWICLRLAKESGGKVDNKILAETLNLTPGAAAKRLSRLGKAIEAQLKASGDDLNVKPNNSLPQPKSQVDDSTGENPPPAAVKQAKKRKTMADESATVAKEKKAQDWGRRACNSYGEKGDRDGAGRNRG